MTRPTPKAFADLLQNAVTEPGILSRAYSHFHSYSIGNQLLAMMQCHQRGIEPGPMATYPKWKELGRQVRKGEKALTLCMPITIRKKDETPDDEVDAAVFTRFVYKSRWFVLSQTEGEPVPDPAIPSWDADRTLEALNVEQIPFDHTDGNCLGYARDRAIAINPVNPLPHKTRFHELAHVLLGHTAEGEQADGERTPRTLRECEARDAPRRTRLGPPIGVRESIISARMPGLRPRDARTDTPSDDLRP